MSGSGDFNRWFVERIASLSELRQIEKNNNERLDALELKLDKIIYLIQHLEVEKNYNVDYYNNVTPNGYLLKVSEDKNELDLDYCHGDGGENGMGSRGYGSRGCNVCGGRH